jgi:orotidine-5'-phosphate decarboxylase
VSHFGDRLAEAISSKGSAIVVGLDPREELIPDVVWQEVGDETSAEGRIRAGIARFHSAVIETAADLVPAVKPQLAFFEQYGVPGLLAYQDTVAAARDAGLLVIADGKRNDVPSTARAYASAFLDPTPAGGVRAFEADALTLNPYLGTDSIMPFVEQAAAAGKGVFLLVKTSNRGSGDVQDLQLADGRPVYAEVAEMTNRVAASYVGSSGYSSVGAVVGCTHPDAAAEVRSLVPRSFLLVVGYGAQSGDATGVARCFNPGREGAIVNASRSLTYDLPPELATMSDLQDAVRSNVLTMKADLARVEVPATAGSPPPG